MIAGGLVQGGEMSGCASELLWVLDWVLGLFHVASLTGLHHCGAECKVGVFELEVTSIRMLF